MMMSQIARWSWMILPEICHQRCGTELHHHETLSALPGLSMDVRSPMALAQYSWQVCSLTIFVHDCQHSYQQHKIQQLPVLQWSHHCAIACGDPNISSALAGLTRYMAPMSSWGQITGRSITSVSLSLRGSFQTVVLMKKTSWHNIKQCYTICSNAAL